MNHNLVVDSFVLLGEDADEWLMGDRIPIGRRVVTGETSTT